MKGFVLAVFVVCLVIGTSVMADSSSASALGGEFNNMPIAAATPETAIFAGYKGIKIGMTTEEVRKTLGAPKDKSDAMDMYVFSDHESALFYYDASHNVTALMINFTGDLKSALTPKEIFGEDVPTKADGGIFKMVRYPKSGYWISYNRSAGDDVAISIAIQKI